ncbi:MAG: YkgJ family cysteine cluster protein [Desulfobacterales bacterium]|nr:YkgJ family cysteine cluster protein [Desulfobacterales bacterium]
MNFNLEPFFQKYEDLQSKVDGIFAKVQKDFPGCSKCAVECSDCCYALFDLSLIEAMYINQKFNETIKGDKKIELIEKANKADRLVYKLKKQAYKEKMEGRSEDEIIVKMALERIKCPLLNNEQKCDLYEFRPITCRIYGIPLSIQGRAHTCGISAFEEGISYPTANMDIIHQQLYAISQEFSQSIKTKYSQLGDLLVPLSMALLTVYDEEYFGISKTN